MSQMLRMLPVLALLVACGQETGEHSTTSPDRIIPASKTENTDPSPQGLEPFPHPDTSGKTFVSIPGSRVSLPRPEGFEDAEEFPGFLQRSTGASIMVTEVPGPFSKCSAGFIKSQLRARGMRLLKKKLGTAGMFPAALMNISQQAYGKKFLKWILVAGNETETVLITATFPEETADDLSGSLRETILSMQWNPDEKISLSRGLGFAVQAGSLKIAKRLGHNLIFTLNGTFPAQNPEDPIFIAGRSISKVDVEDKVEFSRSRVVNYDMVTGVTGIKSRNVEVDNLEGVEITASAKDLKTGTPLHVYQLILFDDKDYYLLFGMVASKIRSSYEKTFKKMAHSFKRG